MSRNFPNFIEAYCAYSQDEIVPASYQKWVALSLIAGALERSVWIVERGRITYPNLFTLLVGKPGAGKSQAIRPAKPLLTGLAGRLRSGEFKVKEGIITQAGLCEEMQVTSKLPNNQPYSSVFVLAAEGSDSALKNHADDFRSTACAMYDCEELYEKTLKSKSYIIPNPVMNILGGATPEFLGSIVDQNSVMGGLASRFTYVIAEANLPEESQIDQEGEALSGDLGKALVDDLFDIYNLYGRFRFSKDSVAMYNEWWKGYRRTFQAIESERVQSLLARKPMLLKKLIMLHSVAESSALKVTPEHMHKAIVDVEFVTRNVKSVISSAMMSNRDSQAGVIQFIGRSLLRLGRKTTIKRLKQAALATGYPVDTVQRTLEFMHGSGDVFIDYTRDLVELLRNPDDNL